MACSYENGDVYTIELADTFVGPVNDPIDHEKEGLAFDKMME